MSNSQENYQQNGKRPQMLTILCILSYVAGGLAAMSYFMIFSMYSEIIPALTEASEQFPAFGVFMGAGRSFFLTGFVLYFISIMGVSMMWRMRKIGFHFYTGAQVMILLMPLFYLRDFPIPFLDGAITLVFILLYSRFYRLLV
ncbi:MAG: hypothetical protein K9H16_12690 [Bacteroidales bacterium]|nr:hypothetical protein [Bacteroidales bacterium]